MNYVESENEVIYIPDVHPKTVIDLSFKALAKDCKSKKQKLVVHLNIGHLCNIGFNALSKGGIHEIKLYHLQQNIWCELADTVIFSHLEDSIILKNRNGSLETKVLKEKASA